MSHDFLNEPQGDLKAFINTENEQIYYSSQQEEAVKTTVYEEIIRFV